MADWKQIKSSRKREKTLYSIFRFDEGPIRYTLYTFTNVNFTNTPQKQPPKSVPILHMPRHQFPIGMGFVVLGSKLYCIGGRLQKGDHKFNSKRVYVVNLRTIDKTCPEKNKYNFVRLHDMHEGKCYPYVFTLNGQIYVIGGGRNIDSMESLNKGKRNFEVFDPKLGKWTFLPTYEPPNYIPPVILGHTVLLGHRVLFWSEVDSRSFYYGCKLFSFDLENKKWVYEGERSEDQVIKDYISAWNDILVPQGMVGTGPGITVNDTLYTLNCGCIATYHISNNEDDRSIPCDKIRGLEIGFPFKRIESNYKEDVIDYYKFIDICEAELVHLGNEKFCLVTNSTLRRYSEIVKKEVFFLTFQVVKQKRYKADDQFFCWANIFEFLAVDGIDALQGMLLYSFAV